jgi:hydrogenase maturation factor
MTECRDDVCITCSDRLFVVRVQWVSEDGTLIRGVEDGEMREISVELLDGLRPGDVVLVHGGVALQRAEAVS